VVDQVLLPLKAPTVRFLSGKGLRAPNFPLTLIKRKNAVLNHRNTWLQAHGQMALISESPFLESESSHL